MNAPSTEFATRREQEGRRIYRALFRRDIPSILLERYLIAAERMDAELDAQDLDAHYHAVEAQNDLEALEFAARLTGNEYKGTQWRWSPTLLENLDEPGALLDQLSYLLLGGVLPAAARQALLAALTAAQTADLGQAAPILAAGILAAPAFQWR